MAREMNLNIDEAYKKHTKEKYGKKKKKLDQWQCPLFGNKKR